MVASRAPPTAAHRLPPTAAHRPTPWIRPLRSPTPAAPRTRRHRTRRMADPRSAACGTCQSCAMPGYEGTCTVVPRFTDDADSCTGERTCDGLGMCRSKNGTACGDNSECTSLNCVDGVCCNEACDGTCYSCNQQ